MNFVDFSPLTHLNWHLIGMNLESDLLPRHLSQPVVRDDRPRARVVHLGGADPQRSVHQLRDPGVVFDFDVLKLPPTSKKLSRFVVAKLIYFL